MASQTLHQYLAFIAAAVVCLMCNFGSASRAECLAAVASVVAAYKGPLRREVAGALDTASVLLCRPGSFVPGLVDLALTLVEAMAQQSGPPPEHLDCPIHVTGICSWLPADSWVCFALKLAEDGYLDVVQGSNIEAASSVRRKVVATAVIRCVCRMYSKFATS